ncbi:DUF3466 family protein [Alteromonas sediminis]|uniref:DUF3466 family protein n=1 Tax=Alteromonas sediminis TaxID=2259342 RepID=A0A3N5YD29_9ALTE|nr:DUF3466 family protein [Alteromonas sediminis]RPJ67345.1 DUF3466 family protein [Alteromonas sediminis]
MRKTILASAVALASLSLTTTAAVYDVDVLTANDLAQNVFAKGIDDTGNALVVVQNEYNQPIDLSQLDFDNEAFTANLTDVDAAKEGNFNDADYNLIIALLRSSTGRNTGGQRLPNFRSYQQSGVQINSVFAFDELNENFNALSRSNQVIVRDSLNGDYFVGTSDDAFSLFTYTDTDGDEQTIQINDFGNRGFVQINGVTTGLPGPYSTLGGSSDAFAINNNLQVAGSAIVSVSENVTDAIERCDDDDARGDTPIEVCRWRINYPNNLNGASVSAIVAGGQRRAVIWELSTDGTLVNTQEYGLLFEPEEDDTFLYLSEAVDINDAGIAIGTASTGEIVEITRPNPNSGVGSNIIELGVVATSFHNGEMTELLDRSTFSQSRALVINNNNWVAGISAQVASTTARDKLFVKNLDSGEERIVNGFFTSSQTTPRDINDNNIIVGEAEVEVSNEARREKNAFMYNIETDEFVNLNTLIPCDAPYTLVDAVGINNNDEILVTARASSPIRDARGQDVLDDDGNQQLIDKAIVLKLSPNANGQVEECGGSTDTDTIPERQGASLPLSVLGFLAGALVFFRRYNERD